MTDGDAEGGPAADPPERFLVDAMLGSLATYLRMCGYDAAYVLDDVEPERRTDPDATPARAAVLDRAAAEGRTLLTRSRELAAAADGSLLVRSRDVEDQLAELAAAGIELELPPDPRRCGTCNGRLDRVSPEERTPAEAPSPAETPVWRCQDCGQHFWRGSHWADVAATLSAIDRREPEA